MVFTTNFVKKIKYEKDESDLEKKISDLEKNVPDIRGLLLKKKTNRFRC